MLMKMFYLHLLAFALLSHSSFPQDITREQFPDGFLFGTSSSAYQYEGSILEDGKGLSNWDVFTHIPGYIADGTTGDVADDHYHRYMEDVEQMHSLGVDAYRFSISWSRILPRGRYGDVNPSGIEFYNKLIDSLVFRGIQPFVTLHHVDFPQELEDRYGSWLSAQMQDDFLYLADICFKNFGDRVKYWTTINEPNLVSSLAYLRGIIAPARCSTPFGNCSEGDSNREPFIAAHNMILAHANAARLYRDRYQPKQHGYIGIVIYCKMFRPLRQLEEDYEAAQRALAFNIAWILDPLLFGDYPNQMVELLKDNLPRFSAEEVEMMKNSVDFIGVNHYTTIYAKDCLHSACQSQNTATEGFVYTTGVRDGVPIGEVVDLFVQPFYVVPDGMEDMIKYLQKRYNNTPMYVTENGYAELDQPDKPEHEHLHDIKRVEYHKNYLKSLHKAIRDGADVRGYFIWSLLDDFEWIYGYTLKFGLHYVDYGSLRRTPKLSALWYREFLTGECNKLRENH